MKAIVKEKAERGFALKEIPEPQVVDALDVKIEMLCVGVCGTDYHIYQWDEWAQKTIRVPHTNGHEGVGRVVAVGTAVEKVKVGELVAFEAHIFDQTCSNCQKGRVDLCQRMKVVGIDRPGVWSEFAVLPEKALFPVSEQIPIQYLALLDPWGNADHLQSKSNLKNKNVLVVGDGPIGVLAALIARTKQAKTVVLAGINEYRLQIARKCELTTVNAKTNNLAVVTAQLTNNEGIDVVLEASGSVQALKESLALVNAGGDVNILSLYPEETIGLNINDLVAKNIRIQTVFGRRIWSTWTASYDLLHNQGIPWRFLDEIITHQLPLVEWERGMKLIEAKKAMKVLLFVKNNKPKSGSSTAVN